MSEMPEHILLFESKALDSDKSMLVMHAAGRERMSAPYEFDLRLITKADDIDPAKLLTEPCSLVFRAAAQMKGSSGFGTVKRHVHGVLRSIERVGESAFGIEYHAELVPHWWLTTQNLRTRAFEQLTIPKLVEQVLQPYKDVGLDFRFDLAHEGDYTQREYIVQYQETDFAFLSRWLEHEGIHYYFDQTGDTEVIVFGDSTSAYGPVNEERKLRYLPSQDQPGELGEQPIAKWFEEVSIHHLAQRHQRVPAGVRVNDVTWKKPDLDLAAKQMVNDKVGFGTIDLHRQNFESPESGKRLAKVRSEELAAGAVVVHGRSDCHAFMPGLVFEMKEHPHDALNAEYVLTEVSIECAQTFVADGSRASGAGYRNTFTAIPATVIYRPVRVTSQPSVTGLLNGWVKAELNKDGMYRVEVPWDTGDGNAKGVSCLCRMAQPFAGGDYGMNFPLHVNTEVVLSHLEGDPDRPIIVGALYDAMDYSPVIDKNAGHSILRSKSGNVIQMSDVDGAAGLFWANGDRSVMQLAASAGGGGGGGGGSTGAARDARQPMPSTGMPGKLHSEERLPLGGGDVLGLGDNVMLDEGEGGDDSSGEIEVDGVAATQDLATMFDEFKDDPSSLASLVYSLPVLDAKDFALALATKGKLEYNVGNSLGIQVGIAKGEYAQNGIKMGMEIVGAKTENLTAGAIVSTSQIGTANDAVVGGMKNSIETWGMTNAVEAKMLKSSAEAGLSARSSGAWVSKTSMEAIAGLNNSTECGGAKISNETFITKSINEAFANRTWIEAIGTNSKLAMNGIETNIWMGGVKNDISLAGATFTMEGANKLHLALGGEVNAMMGPVIDVELAGKVGISIGAEVNVNISSGTNISLHDMGIKLIDEGICLFESKKAVKKSASCILAMLGMTPE